MLPVAERTVWCVSTGVEALEHMLPCLLVANIGPMPDRVQTTVADPEPDIAAIGFAS